MNEGTPDRQSASPAISIVLATYNRPAVLAFAIRSVLAQDFQDWELVVVGDCCSAETAALVASFADPRIRYENLALNHGEQSGPNNLVWPARAVATSHFSITTIAGSRIICVHRSIGYRPAAPMS